MKKQSKLEVTMVLKLEYVINQRVKTETKTVHHDSN